LPESDDVGTGDLSGFDAQNLAGDNTNTCAAPELSHTT
jgi:hypothetical protein